MGSELSVMAQDRALGAVVGSSMEVSNQCVVSVLGIIKTANETAIIALLYTLTVVTSGVLSPVLAATSQKVYTVVELEKVQSE